MQSETLLGADLPELAGSPFLSAARGVGRTCVYLGWVFRFIIAGKLRVAMPGVLKRFQILIGKSLQSARKSLQISQILLNFSILAQDFLPARAGLFPGGKVKEPRTSSVRTFPGVVKILRAIPILGQTRGLEPGCLFCRPGRGVDRFQASRPVSATRAISISGWQAVAWVAPRVVGPAEVFGDNCRCVSRNVGRGQSDWARHAPENGQ